jgi:UDP-N-acetylglucosamine--N-acetylmuramyl-(pentapeptide) pyrophosphoryl-undecaprenol N-acetylglucosamine transferase
MTLNRKNAPYIAIACGGTGGHLFPGLAVAGELRRLGCDVALLVSPKEVDQKSVKLALARDGAESSAGAPFEVHTLPAVALQNRNYFSFVGSFIKSLLVARGIFRRRQPRAVLAMGGFTSAPPILAAKFFGARKARAKTFLHESNTIPGRANRFLDGFVDEAFVGFPETAARLEARKITPTGTPVRPEFQWRDAAQCRAALGLDPLRPTILVVGGSQGASGLNAMVTSVLPLLQGKDWQWLHLTGANDHESVAAAYARLGLKAVVRPFLAEMDLALSAATAAVSRAGASSLAELAAVRLPTVLVPFPAAADNHQFFNARIYAMSGAARLLEQKDSTPEKLAAILVELVEDRVLRAKMDTALELWSAPHSAEQIAANILRQLARTGSAASSESDTAILTRGQAGPRNLHAA